jgi:hypothetical protein
MQNKKERTLREFLEKLQRNIFDLAVFLIFIYCILRLVRIHVPVDELFTSFMGG